MEQNGDGGQAAAAPADSRKYFNDLLVELRHINRMRALQPDSFGHAAALLTVEISRVWNVIHGSELPDEQNEVGAGEVVRLEEKIPIPEIPCTDGKGRRCNLVGRIIGPSGLSVKQLEAETGCEIVIRGRGSIKDHQKQERLRGQPGWEHLNEPLHVVIIAVGGNVRSCEMKLMTAARVIRKLLTPGDDEYKRRQLVQLAVIKGNYRPNKK